MRPDTCEWCCPNCCCSFGGRAETGSSPPVPPCGNGMVRLWKAMVTHTRHPDVHLPSTEYDQYLHKYHPAPAKGMFLDLTNFGKGCCSADGKNEFSLSANGNFILKFVFPDASQLFDAESVTQQEGSVLAAERPCPLLKTTSSFPHGRHHSSRCFAAVGPLVCPLQPSPPLWSALWLVHFLPALWTLFLPILLPPSLSPTLPPTRMLFQHPWRTGRGEHMKDAGRASLFSFTCSPLPVQQTLLPLPSCPYLPAKVPLSNIFGFI